ncbi:hypothetical protein AVEN_221880-1 [Araneus ventricosus]|uniref:Uncharacterized protein n=1 Tax=Araneus ventricosus TaxID=182803 RepID=A0A4Y2SU04_ARAVE|nr:hypothetical protein AVEN_221880-1 [Araneus ventricosus]
MRVLENYFTKLRGSPKSERRKGIGNIEVEEMTTKTAQKGKGLAKKSRNPKKNCLNHQRNSRKQITEGIRDIGNPPVYPLVILDVNEDINDNIAKMVMRINY